jgi:hypothetical protein
VRRSSAIHHLKKLISYRERRAIQDAAFEADTNAIRWALAALREMPHGWRPDQFNPAEFDAACAEEG